MEAIYYNSSHLFFCPACTSIQDGRTILYLARVRPTYKMRLRSHSSSASMAALCACCQAKPGFFSVGFHPRRGPRKADRGVFFWHILPAQTPRRTPGLCSNEWWSPAPHLPLFRGGNGPPPLQAAVRPSKKRALFLQYREATCGPPSAAPRSIRRSGGTRQSRVCRRSAGPRGITARYRKKRRA